MFFPDDERKKLSDDERKRLGEKWLADYKRSADSKREKLLVDDERKKSNDYILGMSALHVEQSIKQACILAKNRHRAQEKRAAMMAEIKAGKTGGIDAGSTSALNTLATLNVEDLRVVFRVVNNMDVHVYNRDLETKHPNPFRYHPAIGGTHLKRVALVKKEMRALDKKMEKVEKRRESQAAKRAKAVKKARGKLTLFEEFEAGKFGQ